MYDPERREILIIALGFLVVITMIFLVCLPGCATLADHVDDYAWHREPKEWWVTSDHGVEMQVLADGATYYRHSRDCALEN